MKIVYLFTCKPIPVVYVRVMENLLQSLRKLLADNPRVEAVQDSLADLGFDQYPAHVFTGHNMIVKLSYFAKPDKKPPFPCVPTEFLSGFEDYHAWVIQPICKRVSLAEAEEFMDNYGTLEIINTYDLHDGNIGEYKEELVAFDW